jgi:hypothetical protein
MLVENNRIWVLFLTFVFVLSGVVVLNAGNVAADQDGDYTYSVSNGEANITGYTGYGGAITIPSTLGGYPVVAIGDDAFDSQRGSLVTSVIMPDGVRYIGAYAFGSRSGISSLSSIQLSERLEIIGGFAFSGCIKLSSISFPSGLNSLGGYAFFSCTSITSVTIPANISYVGPLPFYLCTSLTSIDVDPSNTNFISIDGILYDKGLTRLIECPCNKIGNVTIPNSVTTIEDSAFFACLFITTITVPSSVTTIKEMAFSQCASLKFFTIPDNMTSIANHLFEGCNNLSYMVIPSEVVYIGDYAFSGCSSMTSISFLSLDIPLYVGEGWISRQSTDPQKVGHTYRDSNFPARGETFYGLLMGGYLDPLLPDAPSGLVAIGGTNSITLNWTAPNDDGGGDIDYYIVYQDNIALPTHFTGLTANITDLEINHSYSFTVAAHNLAGLGNQSNSASATTFTVPDAPTGLTAISGNGQITLSWNEPSYNGGALIDYYVIFQDGALSNETTSELSILIYGLTNGQDYSFTVAAHSEVGIGKISNPVIATPSQTVPTIPLDVIAFPFDSGVEVAWSEPEDDGGFVITSYSIYRAENGGAITYLSTVNSTIRQFIDNAITPGQSYVYYIQAINELGASAYSEGSPPIIAYSLVRLDIGSVSSVTGLGITNTLTGRIGLVSNDQPITGLEITLAYSVNNGNSWIDLPTVISSSDGSFNRSWIPTAEGVYLIRAAWLGNDQYPSSEAIFSLAIAISTANDIFTVQSNSIISNLLFNSETKQLSFTVSGESGTSGYTRIIISKELVADGNDIIITLDGAEMNYELSSTDTSWVLNFTYSHSSHDIVADLNGDVGLLGSDGDSTLLAIGLVLTALVSIIIIAMIYRKQKGKK